MTYRLLLPLVAVFLLGAGPCDMFMADQEDPLGDGGPECGPSDCTNLLAINVIRADNEIFQPGFYTFTLQLPDQSTFGIECYYGYAETGLSCETGSTGNLAALMGVQGATIQILFLGAPKWTYVTIEYNNAPIGKRTITPSYTSGDETRDPCAVNCLSATEAMAVESF